MTPPGLPAASSGWRPPRSSCHAMWTRPARPPLGALPRGRSGAASPGGRRERRPEGWGRPPRD
eukprot:9935650-Lingulodinium_polyedra.AAC.1